MPSPGSSGSWWRIGAQAGLLAGIGLVFAGGALPGPAGAAPMVCQKEGNCTFKKPLFGVLLDYSTSMNEPFDANTTRWEGAVDAITQAINFDNGYIAENFILGLVRFGHDPDPNAAGTKIANDSSGLVDGQKLDVGWYDTNVPDKPYIECSNGDAIIAALATAGAPLGGNKFGIGTWTRGAMEFVQSYLAKTYADHPGDMGKRRAVLMLITDGKWTNPQGNMNLAPANQDPALTAANLYNNQEVPTYVVALGDAVDQAFADTLAAAGGTMKAIDAKHPQALQDALKAVIVKVQEDVVVPLCAPGRPRMMVLLDASSSMLNINGGTMQAPAGVGRWDQAREALAGPNSIFDIVLNNHPAEDLVHLGIAVFGHNVPSEEKLLVQYGPCHKDNFAWALDPKSSCEAPGCVDPYGGPPIEWTFKDGSLINPPGFDEQTLSHMPRCDFTAQLPNACVGSGTYAHLGLNLIHTNIVEYQAACKMDGAVYSCDDQTQFINILIMDGKYNSTDAQVQLPLTAMYSAGITTHVIGFGDAVDAIQLNKLADWGSGNLLDYYDANNQDQLELALKSILEQLSFDECCSFNDCSVILDPGRNSDPDPLPPASSSSTGSSSTGSATVTGTTGSTSAAESGTSSTSTGASGTSTTSEASTGSGGSSGASPTTTMPRPTGTSAGDGSASSSGGANETEGGCACTIANGRGGSSDPGGALWSLGVLGLLLRRRRLRSTPRIRSPIATPAITSAPARPASARASTGRA
jgi:MYXO-CTERM domain-containing protein